MKEPKEPFKSGKYIFFTETSDHPFFCKNYMDPDTIDEYIDEYDGDENLEEMDTLYHNTDVISVQDVLDKMPKGANPKDIFITLHRQSNFNAITVKVSHRVQNDKEAWQKARDEEEAEYQKKLAIYKEKFLNYQLWLKENQIEKIKKEISNLKK